MDFLRNQKRLGVILLSILSTVLFVLLLAPPEATLGEGIRTVYLHVGLIWTGMAGFVAAAFIGALILWRPLPNWLSWLETVSWVAFGFYTAGVLMSMVASWDNWGAVFMQEPRMSAAVNSLAVAIIVLIISSWSPWPRVRGGLQILLLIVIFWLTYSAPKILHPSNPIWSSDSLGIQLAFLSLFLLFAGAASYLAWHLYHRRRISAGKDNNQEKFSKP